MTEKMVADAIEECIRWACHEPSDHWYAVTLWPDGYLEHRRGCGTVTYGEDEYDDSPGWRTIFAVDGIPDIDPDRQWIDPETKDLDEEAAIDAIVEWYTEY